MIIFLYGEDCFRSHQKLVEIREKYLESDKSGSGLSSFECDEKASAEKIINAFETANLLAPKRLVVIKRLIASEPETGQKMISEFFRKRKSSLIEGKDLIIVFWEEYQPKKSNLIYKFLEKNAKKQNFEKLTGIKLNSWIIGKIKKINPESSISKPALEKLVLYAGNETIVLDKEIEKLVNYSGEKMIDEDDIDTLINANFDSNIFATVDAIGVNNKKEALFLLHQHLKKGDDPFYIFSMFLYQFRNLLKIADLKESGISSEYEISKITKMHPFVIRKSIGQIRSFTVIKLKKIYQRLGNMDTEIKTGKIDINLALDKFVAEL